MRQTEIRVKRYEGARHGVETILRSSTCVSQRHFSLKRIQGITATPEQNVKSDHHFLWSSCKNSTTNTGGLSKTDHDHDRLRSSRRCRLRHINDLQSDTDVQRIVCSLGDTATTATTKPGWSWCFDQGVRQDWFLFSSWYAESKSTKAFCEISGLVNLDREIEYAANGFLGDHTWYQARKNQMCGTKEDWHPSRVWAVMFVICRTAYR